MSEIILEKRYPHSREEDITDAFMRGYVKGKADRPQGEWIDAEIPLECGGTMPIQVCNLCKTFYPLAYTGGGHRFCPNCGARMKGADDERVRKRNP